MQLYRKWLSYEIKNVAKFVLRTRIVLKISLAIIQSVIGAKLIVQCNKKIMLLKDCLRIYTRDLFARVSAPDWYHSEKCKSICICVFWKTSFVAFSVAASFDSGMCEVFRKVHYAIFEISAENHMLLFTPI